MDLTGTSLLLVADGRRARLFEERRRGGALIEVTGRLGDLTHHRPAASGFRGRIHDRFGPPSHTGGGPAPQERRENDFVDAVAARAVQILRGGDYQDLILIAAPRALGRLRRGVAHAGLTPGLAEARDRVAETATTLRDALRDLRTRA